MMQYAPCLQVEHGVVVVEVVVVGKTDKCSCYMMKNLRHILENNEHFLIMFTAQKCSLFIKHT